MVYGKYHTNCIQCHCQVWTNACVIFLFSTLSSVKISCHQESERLNHFMEAFLHIPLHDHIYQCIFINWIILEMQFCFKDIGPKCVFCKYLFERRGFLRSLIWNKFFPSMCQSKFGWVFLEIPCCLKYLMLICGAGIALSPFFDFVLSFPKAFSL